MEASLTLLNAHIQILNTQLALIHIPLRLYHSFLHPILRLLLAVDHPKRAEQEYDSDGAGSDEDDASQLHFVNISITPIECSIACSSSLAKQLFVPVRDTLDDASKKEVSISHEDFMVMQVDGEGLDAGQRVLELTTPLAMAGISIFFITTYFSDYILVPQRNRGQVIHALEERGFVFEHGTSSYINAAHHRNSSSTSSADVSAPRTPPPSTISELQTRTFATLKKRNVVPTVDNDIRLIQCAGRKDAGGSTLMNGSSTSPRGEAVTAADDKLHLGLVRCLISTPLPSFLSLTLTDTEPPSLLLEKRLLHHFESAGDTDCSVLLGSKEDILIPIILDLRELPLESTGIVCGVAGRLVGVTQGQLEQAVEMSYLSTARAGTVMVPEDELERALQALSGAENGVHPD